MFFEMAQEKTQTLIAAHKWACEQIAQEITAKTSRILAKKYTTNKVLACVNVVASAMANGTLTTRARVFASKVFPILTVKITTLKSG